MALSNWLTRLEWNACYFAGMKCLLDGKKITDLGEQLRLGISVLHKAGYNFVGITSHANGNFEKVTQCCDKNAGVLVELMDGSFDVLERAKDLLAWKNGPKVDWSWLAKMVAEAEAGEKDEKEDNQGSSQAKSS